LRKNFAEAGILAFRFASLREEPLKLKSALGIERPKESPDDLGKNGGA
jgi:hypothetical protein